MEKLGLAIRNFIQSQAGQILLGAVLCHLFILPILLITLSVSLAGISQDTFINNVRFTSNLIGEYVTEDYLYESEEELINKLDSVLLGAEILYIEFQHPQGVILPSLLEADELLVFQEDFEFAQNNDSVYFISIPVDSAPNAVLHIGFDEQPTVALINIITVRLITFLMAYAMSFLLVMLWWGKRVFQPIAVLREILHRITFGDLNRKIEVKSSLREVRELSADMETMRSTLVRKTLDFEELSKKDILTELPNRAVLASQLDQAIQVGEEKALNFCVAVMDLDNFKIVNDRFGHSVGDAVLQEAALRMKKALRTSDFIARLGGDEFAFIFYDASPAVAKECIGNIASVLNSAFHEKEHEIVLGSSTGISSFPKDGNTSSDLLRKADVAMYEAKENSEEVNVYKPEFDEAQLKKLQIKSELKFALNEDQFVVHYQPKFNLHTGELDSLEALLRWQHPDRGLMLPDSFIEIAEESRIINDLSLWLVARIGEDLKYFEDQGLLNIKIAMNVSPRTLLEENFSNKIIHTMNTLGIDPHKIELELTENYIVTDPVRAREVLTLCSEQGMSIAIDDFGVGYSSMTYLKDFPIDTLKIDKSFVMDLDEHETNNSVIVKASIDLAHNLGIKVVAEGVDSLESVKFLKLWDCDFVQGYLLSKPLPKKELVTLLAGNTIQGIFAEAE